MLERSQRVEAGEERDWQSLPVYIQPQWRWPTQNTNGVVTPNRREVVDTFRVMPHAIFVDDVPTALRYHLKHAPIDMIRHARDHVTGCRPHPLRPVAPH